MKRLALSLLAVIVLVAGIIMVFTSRGGEAARTELGHARQAFFRHVGTYWSGATPSNEEISLYLLDSPGITEFSQYSNINAAEFVESSSRRTIPLTRTAFERDGDYADDIAANALTNWIPNDTSGLVYRVLTYSFELDPTYDGLVADSIRVSFIDGVTEDYPIGSIRFRYVRNDLDMYTIQTFVDPAMGDLVLPEGRFHQGDYPGGRLLYGFMFGIAFDPETDAEKRVVDADMGIPGVYVDWMSPISLNDGRILTSPELEEFRKERGPADDDPLSLFYGKVNALRADEGRHFPEYQHTPRVGSMPPPEFKPLGMADCAPSGLSTGAMALERAYPLYYDPEADFTNTCLIIQPMLIVENEGRRMFTALNSPPEILPPCKLEDVPGLLEAQNP